MRMLACEKAQGNCMGCFYADERNQWLDVAPYNPVEIEVDDASMELCQAKHKTPVT